MAGNMSRGKGQRGEREAATVFAEWSLPVCDYMGEAGIELKRNLMQSRQGGYDLVGLDWLALEVKRHETLSVGAWWTQTLKQAGPGQIPVLMYRQNRTPWRFRVRLKSAHFAPCGQFSTTSELVADLVADQAKLWYQHELYIRLKAQKGVDMPT